MPLSLLRPTGADVSRLMDTRANAAFSYPCEGATKPRGETGHRTPPRGWTVDHSRVLVGRGPGAFDAAADAVRNWVMFDLDWARLASPAGPPRAGQLVAMRARHLGIWSVNPCRVLYVIDDARRYGFGYGTVAGHAMRGEERFLVERDAADDVWFSILAVSRPGAWITVLAYPYVRVLQARFRRDATAAIVRAVARRVPAVRGSRGRVARLAGT